MREEGLDKNVSSFAESVPVIGSLFETLFVYDDSAKSGYQVRTGEQ